VATSALRAVEFVGMPEARIPLAQAAIYVALAPKSNASYRAIEARAFEDVKTEETMEVPDHLKTAAIRELRTRSWRRLQISARLRRSG